MGLRRTLIMLAASVILLCSCDKDAMVQNSDGGSVTVSSAAAEEAEPSETPVRQEAAKTVPAVVEEASQTAGTMPKEAASPHTLVPLKETGTISSGGASGVISLPESTEDTYVLTLDGLEYDTGVPAAGVSCYVSDIDMDGTSEILLVSPKDKGAQLYLFQPDDGELKGAAFTYTLSQQLSDSGTQEEITDAPCLIFSGVEPIVSLGDGSFAVLAFGNAFQRLVFDSPTMRVVETEPLPLDILTGGDVPVLDDAVHAAG